MPLIITHPKINQIADWTQADLDAQIAAGFYPPGTLLADITLPSDWNNDHSISGTINQDQNNVAVDGVTITGNGTPGDPLVAVGDGTGDVHGPASSTDNAIARYDSTTGKIIDNSLATVDDFGVIGSNGANLSGNLNLATTTSGNLNLATTTSGRALVTDGSKNVISSATTATEIGYVNGVTSAIQTQINGKQATGNYITALSGDVTASGPGSSTATLATVNADVGTFGTANTVSTVTVDGKGRVTAATDTFIAIASTSVTDFNEAAQDAVGGIVDSTLVYSDGTPSIGRAAVTGDITIAGGSNVSAIAAGVIVNADVNASAAIAASKLAALTSGRAVVTDGSGFISAATTTSTEIGYVNGVTSSIQTQLNALSGAGYVVGPASATDNAIAVYNLTTGKVLKNSTALISTTGTLILAAQASVSYTAGALFYDSTNDCFTAFNGNSNVALQVGRENWTKCQNNSGVSIPNGKAVTITGASGGLPTIALAQANTNIFVIGLATQTIANGSSGEVTTYGKVNGIDTSAFAAGATLYVSATVAGDLTATAPVAPNYRIRVGTVGVSNAVTGDITVSSPTTALGLGAANQLMGMNTAGTAAEYKTVSSTTSITAVQAANALSFQRAAITGDVAIAVNANTSTLATVNANVGTFGSATQSAVPTVNAKGLITAISNSTITPAVGSITGLGANVATFLATPSSANLIAALTDEIGPGSAIFGSEGTFTPVVVGTVTPGTGTVYTSALGYYARYGNTVFYNIYLNYNSLTGAVGNMRITGLPFTSRNTTSLQWATSVPNQGNLAAPITSVVCGIILPNTSQIDLYSTATGGGTTTALAVDTAAVINFQGFYQV